MREPFPTTLYPLHTMNIEVQRVWKLLTLSSLKDWPHRFLACTFSLLLLTIIGCGRKDQAFRVATAPEGATYYNISRTITDAVEEVHPWNFTYIDRPDLGSITNCRLLQEGEVDFALAQNDTPIHQFYDSTQGSLSLRTLLPLYPEVLFIIHHNSIEASSLLELVAGRRVSMGEANSGTFRFVRRLFHDFGIDTNAYTTVYTSFAENHLSDSIDISCSLTGYNNPKILKMLTEQQGKIFSLGDFRLVGIGSAVEGFCFNYPHARSFIIPRNAYHVAPSTPILTLAVDAVLLTRDDIEDDIVQRMVETVFMNRQLLANRSPLLTALREDFDEGRLSFPLHNGVRMYMERNRPSFFERYAEVMGVGLSILVILAGLLSTFLKWQRQRKKDRIDVYYARILALGRDVMSATSEVELTELTKQIDTLRHEAFGLLIDEKLVADESFRIFITLTNDTLRSIESRKEAFSES